MTSFQEPPKEFSETNERAIQPFQSSNPIQPIETQVKENEGKQQNQAYLDTLLRKGFDWTEATNLLNLRDNLYGNTEMRQRLADDIHMQFARWLYEQGEMNDLCDD